MKCVVVYEEKNKIYTKTYRREFLIKSSAMLLYGVTQCCEDVIWNSSVNLIPMKMECRKETYQCNANIHLEE